MFMLLNSCLPQKQAVPGLHQCYLILRKNHHASSRTILHLIIAEKLLDFERLACNCHTHKMAHEMHSGALLSVMKFQ